MDKICQYSTIIFASNVAVLLTVSVVTDYWEYRGFDLQKILSGIEPTNRTALTDPEDTNSYIEIDYYWDLKARSKPAPDDVQKITYYQSPALVYKYFSVENYVVNRSYFDGCENVTEEVTLTRVHRWRDVILLYVQYGNLFRECDSLEAGVRSRLGIIHIQHGRCFNFVTTFRNGDYVHRELPAIIHLERSAFLFAVVCVISSVTSVIGGGYGSLAKNKQSILTASTAALISGVSLTIAIALFHGKCHLLHRRQFMAGIDVPYKKILDKHRIYEFGWSFVLAWICVALCFIHSWMWLKKSQDMDVSYSTKRQQLRHQPEWTSFSNDTVIFDL